MDKMTGHQLAVFAHEKIGTPYIYGAKGKVVTQANFAYLRKTYGDKFVPYTDIKKVGQACVDCSGLIGWACGVWLNSAGWREKARKEGHVHPISTLKKAPVGALVWCEGHIGIYVGIEKGTLMYIAADGSKYGTRKAPISANRFTHWLLVPSVFDYEEEEMVTKEKIEIFGKEIECEVIRKDGKVYPYIRDFGEKVGLKITNKGKMPVVEKK